MTGWGDGNGGTQRRKDAMKSGFPQHPAVIPGVPPVIAGVLPSLPVSSRHCRCPPVIAGVLPSLPVSSRHCRCPPVIPA